MNTSQPIRLPALAAAICAAAALSWSVNAHAQLITSWNAPSVDDGNSIPDFTAAWDIDATTGQFLNLPALGSPKALAADNQLRRLYTSGGNALSTFELDGEGRFVKLSGPVQIRDTNGVGAEPYQIESMGFVNGVIYASVSRSSGDEKRRRGISKGFYAIDPATAVATLIPAAQNLPLFKGLDFNTSDGRMYGVVGNSNAQSIVSVDLASFTYTTIVGVPASAYAFNIGSFSFDGVAVGNNKVYLTHGQWYASIPIVVFDLATLSFGPSLPTPPRRAENRSYPSGATFFAPVAR
jgi:hypothetical protein